MIFGWLQRRRECLAREAEERSRQTNDRLRKVLEERAERRRNEYRDQVSNPYAAKRAEVVNSDPGFDTAGFAFGLATGMPISPSHGVSSGSVLGASMHSSPAEPSYTPPSTSAQESSHDSGSSSDSGSSGSSGGDGGGGGGGGD